MVRVLVACVFLSLAACGPKVPQHAGYKTKSPWKKSKPIVLDEKLQAKAKGSLDYGAYKRAKWYYVEITGDGTLDLKLDFQPTDDGGDATVAMEVLDASYRVISEDEDAPVVAEKKAKKKKHAKHEDDEGDEEGEEDEEDDGDADDEGSGDETQKTRQLTGLHPGRYYVHLFLTGRLDSADYELQVGFTSVATSAETDFPKQVAWLPSLPVVPVEDDAPAVAKKPERKPHGGGGKKPPKDKPPEEPAEEPAGPGGPVKGLVIGAAAASGGSTNITINGGTDAGLAAGRKGTLAGVKNGAFTITSCSQRSCKATVKASLDEVNKSTMQVTIK